LEATSSSLPESLGSAPQTRRALPAQALQDSSSMARVFISYARESDDQRERVSAFARRLRGEGVDAWIDQFVEDNPPYWPTWMLDEIERADVVLCVISRIYKERFESQERLTRGRGVNWEALMMTEAAYADLPQAHRKFIAVVFDTDDLQHVPGVLLGSGRTAYVLYRDYDSLYRRMTGQGRPLPPLGEVRDMGGGRSETSKITVHSRPPFVPLRFLDRTRETDSVRDAIQHVDGGCTLITARPGIGKTALISRLLQDLEDGSGYGVTDFAYVSAGGSTPITLSAQTEAFLREYKPPSRLVIRDGPAPMIRRMSTSRLEREAERYDRFLLVKIRILKRRLASGLKSLVIINGRLERILGFPVL
jgi:hypothetical protein